MCGLMKAFVGGILLITSHCTPCALKDAFTCTGLSIWNFFLPSPQLSIRQTGPYSSNLAQMSPALRSCLGIPLS